MGLSSELWGWEFLPPLQLPQVFTVRGFEALFPHAGMLGCSVYLAPHLFLLVYLHTNVEPPGPLHPSCPSPLLLPVWMNVSSLTVWLSDFHTVQFSGSSGCSLFLNWLLSFFWLCEEAQCIYYASILAGSLQ